MHTQGLLTLIKDGRVFMKVVIGSNGYQIPTLRLHLEYTNPSELTPENVYQLALNILRAQDSLVVQHSANACVFEEEFSPEPGSLYYDRWQDPRFNPRWSKGTAPYTEVIDLDSPKRLSA